MEERRRREMLRLIESELQILQSEVSQEKKSTGKKVEKSEKTTQWVAPTEAFETNYREPGQGLEEKERIDIVSYNILSLELGGDDYYRNLDGTVQTIDTEERKQAIHEKINTWVLSGKVICLQEVTHSFINKEANPILHDILCRNAYAAYSHFYSYMPNKVDRTKKGTCRLGLATLIPRKYYDVKLNGLLRPWENPEIPLEVLRLKERHESEMQDIADDLNTLSKTADAEKKVKLGEELRDKWKLGANITTTSMICGGLASQRKVLQQAVNKLMAEYKNSTPGFGDRSVIILKIEDKNKNEMLIANVHFPCQYRYPKIMASIAIKTKLCILNWMVKHASQASPLLLCGDFNSSPKEEAGSAYHCLIGKTEFTSPTINRSFINPEDFEKAVSTEPWEDCLASMNADGCTNYGFTKSNFEECKKEFHAVLDSLMPMFSMFADTLFESDPSPIAIKEAYIDAVRIPREDAAAMQDIEQQIGDVITKALEHKKKFITPKSLLLDHFFMRDRDQKIEKVDLFCPSSWFTAGLAGGKPLPNLQYKQPSDHLAIELSLQFTDQVSRHYSVPIPEKEDWP